MKKALLIIDPQKCFFKKGHQEVVEGINKIQGQYNYVAISKYLNYKDSPFIKKLNWTDCMPGSRESEFAIKVKKDSFVFEKTTYTSLTEDLENWIKSNNIDHIDVCGISSDACVLATAFSLFDNNYSFRVLEKLCAASKDSYHKMGIDIIRRNIDKEEE